MLASQAPEPALVVPALGGTQSVPPVSRAASKNKQLLASLDRPESSNVARLNAGDEKAMQGRLAQHLAEIKARSADQSNLLPNFNPSFGDYIVVTVHHGGGTNTSSGILGQAYSNRLLIIDKIDKLIV